MRKIQEQRLLEYMQNGNRVTQIDALNELGIMRLASRVSDLKKAGYEVQDKWVSGKNKFDEQYAIKQYWMEKPPVVYRDVLGDVIPTDKADDQLELRVQA